MAKPNHADLDRMCEEACIAERVRLAFVGIDSAIMLALSQPEITVSDVRTYLTGHVVDLEEFDRDA